MAQAFRLATLDRLFRLGYRSYMLQGHLVCQVRTCNVQGGGGGGTISVERQNQTLAVFHALSRSQNFTRNSFVPPTPTPSMLRQGQYDMRKLG
jgi:hypothetical protein